MRGPGCEVRDREHGDREPDGKPRHQQHRAPTKAVRTLGPGARTHREERQPERLRNADQFVRRLTHPDRGASGTQELSAGVNRF